MLLSEDNKVMQLCAAGALLESEPDKALPLYDQAWQLATNDAEQMIVAQHLARVQDDLYEVLQWNLVALHHAEAMPQEEVSTYLPSLYFNIGKSYEELHNKEEALFNYRLAQKNIDSLPDNDDKHKIAQSIEGGIMRLTTQ